MRGQFRVMVFLIALAIFSAPLSAAAQPREKVPRIGFLANVRSPGTEGFEQGLRELGYIEGKNIVIEWRLAEGKFDRLPDLAAELVRLKVDVIVAPADTYVRVAKQATSTIPIVFALVTDPVAAGYVASLRRPGGNITGLSTIELSAKRLQLLKEAIPGLTRVAVLTTPSGAEVALRETEVAARSLGLELERFYVRDPKEFDNAFSAMTRKNVGAVIVVPRIPMFYAERRRISDLAAKSWLPAMYWAREFVEAGGFLSYAESLPDLARRSAWYVDKILKGAKPGDLPVEQPTRFELVINMKTAKALGLTIPQSVLIQAEQVFQ